MPAEQLLNGRLRLASNGNGHHPLQMGGEDLLGNTLGANSFFLTRNDKPFFLISGEFHFARYPSAEWAHELAKIKAGGVNTVASYVFWNYHEQTPGSFDWRGGKDLRHFIELCAQADLYFVLRVGPFVHGEWRNGGLPDWLYGQPFSVRSNDPRYLAHVERLYTEIAAQVRGLFFADGGPIIAVQLENEFMHCGAPWEVQPFGEIEWISAGREGIHHLRALKHIADRVGLIAPYTFITAWGGAPILEDESLPVYSEYAYPTWIDQPPPSTAYLFSDKHLRPVPEPTHRVPNAYPVMMAEQQGGIQVRYNNRPIVPARSTEAMTLVNIGAGCNVLGYYMYHGGTTPPGYAERLHPQRSYDFQAPLGEYGQVRANYQALKLLHQFLDAYGESLAPMQTYLPENAAALTVNDLKTPRYCARTDGDAGFLFVNNFQDHAETQTLENVRFALETSGGTLTIPDNGTLTLERDVCFILPFEQSLQGARLIYATAQPLTILRTPDYVHYFYFAPEGIAPEFCFDVNSCKDILEMERCETRGDRLHIYPQCGADKTFRLTSQDGTRIVITTLTRTEAEQVWCGHAWSGERVILSTAPVIFEQGGVRVNSPGEAKVELTVFPPFAQKIQAHAARLDETSSGYATRLTLEMPPQHVKLRIEDCGDGKFLLQFPADAWRGVSELLLQIDYEGDMAMAFLDGELVADNFCNGLLWEIGLKRFATQISDKGLLLVFRPLRHGVIKNVSSSAAARFEFEGDEKLVIHSITAQPEYSARLL